MAQITFWTSGRGEYFIEDQQLDFIAPAVSFVPSDTVHGFTVQPETSDTIVVSNANSALAPIRILSTLSFDRPVMARGQAENPAWHQLRVTMERLHEDYRSGLAQSLAALIAVATNDISLLAAAGGTSAHSGNDLAQAFKRLIDNLFRENWSVAQYISARGTTPHLLSKNMPPNLRLPITSVIDERRLLEAKRLLLFTVCE